MSSIKEKALKHIGIPKYDQEGAFIWGTEPPKGESTEMGTRLLDVRGFGELSSNNGQEEAVKIQDWIGNFVVEAIKEKLENDQTLEKIKEAFSEYYKSEGCGCCQDMDAHEEAAKKLGKLLDYPQYDDGSGYDFWPKEEKDK